MYETTKAIAIPIKSKTDQYSLSNKHFDPTQNSPPSLWKMRLNKRIAGENHLRKNYYVPNKLCAE